MLGDPTVRVVDVYVPAWHNGQALPLLVDLVGFTGSGLSQTNRAGFHENLPERFDRLIGETAHATGCRRLPGLLHPARRQPVHQLGFHRRRELNQQLEAAQKHPEVSFKVINAMAMAASYDPVPPQFLGIGCR